MQSAGQVDSKAPAPESQADSAQQPEAVEIRFSRPGLKSRNIRKRARAGEASGEAAEEDNTVVHVPKRTERFNPLKQTTSNGRSERATELFYDSTRSAMPNGPADQGATASLETETEQDRDGRALAEKRIKMSNETDHSDVPLYRGTNAYKSYIPKNEEAISNNKFTGTMGPVRATLNVRQSIRFDYQPDICKDYKETGYCGYGDSCKFLHDRSDYKTGWQLDREWNERQKAKIAGVTEEPGAQEASDHEDELPFACFICRRPFVDPIVTKCKHYFCMKCALTHHKKNKKCFVCNENTAGTFNTAHDIIRRQQMQRSSAQSRESDDDDDADADAADDNNARRDGPARNRNAADKYKPQAGWAIR